MDLNLNDKVTIVTGAGRGIGKAICTAFAREKAQVIVTDINSKDAEKVSEAINASGGRAVSMKVDVSQLNEVAEMMRLVVKQFGRIDVLVNNAGISPKKKGGATLTWEILPEEWDMVMKVNLNGTFYCSQEAVKYMLVQQNGAIINISSVAAKKSFVPMPTGSYYNVSKAGVISLTQRLATELASFGIRVNAVAPGRIETFISRATSEEINRSIIKGIPMGRFGRPEEVAELVLFLASDVSSYITGETVSINGGSFMD